MYKDVSKGFRTQSVNKYTLTFSITRTCPLLNLFNWFAK